MRPVDGLPVFKARATYLAFLNSKPANASHKSNHSRSLSGLSASVFPTQQEPRGHAEVQQQEALQAASMAAAPSSSPQPRRTALIPLLLVSLLLLSVVVAGHAAAARVVVAAAEASSRSQEQYRDVVSQ
jgi:hypothetical protein